MLARRSFHDRFGLKVERRSDMLLSLSCSMSVEEMKEFGWEAI